MTRVQIGEVMGFLDRLAESPRTWRLTPRGAIFSPHGGRPWMIAKLYPEECSIDLFYNVVNAADNRRGHSLVIRRAILDACGL